MYYLKNKKILNNLSTIELYMSYESYTIIFIAPKNGRDIPYV